MMIPNSNVIRTCSHFSVRGLCPSLSVQNEIFNLGIDRENSTCVIFNGRER